MGAGGTHQSSSPRFRSDEEAWQAAERLISLFDPPTGLQRHEIRRQSESTDLIHCQFDVKPYGYWSESGNCATVTFRASDGSVKMLLVGRGWTYEAPNIRVTEQQARETAAQRMGVEPSEWQYVIKYAKSTPDLKRCGAQKTQRLVYSLYREANRDGIIIDTVTGEVVGELRAAGTPPPAEQVGFADEGKSTTEGDAGKGAQTISSNPAPVVLLAVFGFTMLAWFGRKLILRS